MNNKIAIIGLGYVGLPLAIEFGKKYNTVGYDINNSRILELNKNIDIFGEHNKSEISVLKFASNISKEASPNNNKFFGI